MMGTKLFACLILLAATACTASTSGADLTPAPVPPATSTVAAASQQPASTPATASQPSASAVPTVSSSVPAQPSPSATARFGDFPMPTPSVGASQATPAATPTATVNSGATPLAPNGWKTFTSTKLQAVLEYPPDWTAREDSAGVSFTSAAGTGIVLARVDTSGASPENFLSEMLPNTRCSSSTNAHGMTVLSCLDTISRAHIAYLFIKPAGRLDRVWSLTTGSRGSLDVFNTMIETVRPEG